MTAYIEADGMRLRRKVRAVVINDDDEVLLVRPHGYREGEWTLAGGGVENGESPVAAMRRELSEELGIGLDVDLEEIPVTNRFIYSPEHKAKRALDHDGQDAVMFSCRIDKNIPLCLQAKEVADARWFPADDAEKAFPVEKQRQIFASCMAVLSKRRNGVMLG
ncbi:MULTISPECIES: NUDIX domain-containing protein [unclassified Sphingopyxis]|jgi:8-oxo-dGTP pyrophosphatase MutT (NUDIX family)|uniref:NUDIX domain-containing protein n=2 Tax=Sphingopyxis TaxID=165697 RepID=UPI001F33CAF9|nr:MULTISPECIES: NUDIX hydrolase [unclassified Sphingopyxis]